MLTLLPSTASDKSQISTKTLTLPPNVKIAASVNDMFSVFTKPINLEFITELGVGVTNQPQQIIINNNTSNINLQVIFDELSIFGINGLGNVVIPPLTAHTPIIQLNINKFSELLAAKILTVSSVIKFTISPINVVGPVYIPIATVV